MKKYYQNYSITSVLITILLILIVFTIVSVNENYYYYLLLIPMLIVFINTPIYYYFENNHLVIKKILWKEKIQSPSVSKVNVTQPFILSSMGFFGYIGYTSDGCQSLTANLKETLLIKGQSNKKILISPKETSTFINNLKKIESL